MGVCAPVLHWDQRHLRAGPTLGCLDGTEGHGWDREGAKVAVRAEARPAGGAQELPVCSSEGSDRVSGAPRAPVPSLALGWGKSIPFAGELEGWITSWEQGNGRQRAPIGIPGALGSGAQDPRRCLGLVLSAGLCG